jgi:hypothetical protein
MAVGSQVVEVEGVSEHFVFEAKEPMADEQDEEKVCQYLGIPYLSEAALVRNGHSLVSPLLAQARTVVEALLGSLV